MIADGLSIVTLRIKCTLTFLDSTNTKSLNSIIGSTGIGELELNGEKFFFQHAYNAEHDYYIFMTVDRESVQSDIDMTGILVPISVLGGVLLVMTHVTIWHGMRGERRHGYKSD